MGTLLLMMDRVSLMISTSLVRSKRFYHPPGFNMAFVSDFSKYKLTTTDDHQLSLKFGWHFNPAGYVIT
jgi:hypothetical protein